ncbi:MAG: ECF transporter S component [[Clostridium] innocuum]
MKSNGCKDIVTAALGIALVFLATWLLKVPNGIQGYFNLGDGFLLLFASVLNPFLAFMVGGVGSALAILAAGMVHVCAIFTLLIKGMEAVLAFLACLQGTFLISLCCHILGGLLMIGGCFLRGCIYQSKLAAFTDRYPGESGTGRSRLCHCTGSLSSLAKKDAQASGYAS